VQKGERTKIRRIELASLIGIHTIHHRGGGRIMFQSKQVTHFVNPDRDGFVICKLIATFGLTAIHPWKFSLSGNCARATITVLYGSTALVPPTIATAQDGDCSS
jgi:hypothetical protein